MITKLLCGIALLLTTTMISLAQTGSVSGTVKTADGQPAEFVSVGVKGTPKGAVTDKDGNFLIKNLEPGSYTIVTSYMGLETKEQPVEVKAGETATVEFILKESAKELQEVVVAGTKGSYKEDSVSSSLRLNTPLQEIPQNIQIVTTTALKDQQVISMSDGLVRNVSGLIRNEHWGDLYTNITARGSQIQAFRNGFNVVNSYWGPLTEDMSLVDHIEFVKGPAGFMLSSGDPSGLYNVVTKKPTGQTKGEAVATIGSFNLYRGSLDLDGKLSNNGRLLYRFNVAAQNKGSFRPNEYNNRYTIAPVVSYKLDDKTKLTLEYNYQRADMSNVGSFYVFSPYGYGTLPVDFTTLPAGTPGTKINDHSAYLILEHNISKNWKITGQLSRFIYNQEGYSMWPSTVNGNGTMIRNIGIWDAQSRMTMGQVFINGDVTTGFIRHRILAGLDASNKNYIADWSQSHDLDTVGAEFNPYEPSLLNVPVNGYPSFDRSAPLSQRAQAGYGYQTQTYSAIYLQDELGFLQNRVRLTLAGRYTDLKQAYAGPADKAQRFSPRVGLSVTAHKSTTVYALYDQSFIPQTGFVYGVGTIQPITGNSMELGVKKDWFDGKWNTTLAVYNIIKNNELAIDPTPDTTLPALPGGAQYSIELGQKTVQGLEFDLRGTIFKGLNLIANYAYTDSKVSKVNDDNLGIKVGDKVPSFAKHTLNGWLTYQIQRGPLKGLGASAGCTWLVDRVTYWEKSPDPNINLADYFKLDAGLFWEKNKLKVTANMFNVLDAYLYSGSYYSWVSAYYWQTDAPRNMRLSVAYRF